MAEGRGGPDSSEIEWQFDALDLRPVERWLASLPSRAQRDGVPTITVLSKPVRRLVDHYVDTQDWRIRQAGLVMRTRQRGRAAEVTMKDTRPADATGLRQRLEVTESLPSGELSRLAPDGPVGERVAAVAGKRPLVQVLEVRTRRHPFSLRAAGTEVAEVALDETTLVVGAGQKPAHLRRVEVEVDPAWVDTLAPVVDDLRLATGLRPASLSKFEAGLLAAGVQVPGPPDLGPTDVGPDTTFGELAFAVVRRHLGVLLARESGTRLGEDIEELHDMRVATRRLRAALDLFVDAFPTRARTLRDELRWLADVLGAVRDLDVQLARMAQMTQWSAGWSSDAEVAPLTHLRELLKLERAEARGRLLEALDSTRWERLAAGLVSMAKQGPNRRLAASRTPAATVVPPLVVARHRAVVMAIRRASRSGEATDFHRLRIRCKRLRYSIEFTAGLYGSGPQAFVRKLTRLQDSLGLMQDAEVASSRLFALATGTGPESDPRAGEVLPPPTVFVMGAVAEHYRAESRNLRQTMARHLGVLTGKVWHRFVALMEHAAQQAAVPAEGTPTGSHPMMPRRSPAKIPPATPRVPDCAGPADDNADSARALPASRDVRSPRLDHRSASVWTQPGSGGQPSGRTAAGATRAAARTPGAGGTTGEAG